MDLMEYKAKELFRSFDIPVMAGVIADTAAEAAEKAASLTFPVVVKSQVPVGGRGKACGIQFAQTPDEATDWAGKLIGMDIKGHTVRKLLIEQAAKPRQELYLSMTLDRDRKMPLILFSSEGGMDIEAVAANHPDKIHRLPVHPLMGVRDYTARYLLSRAGLPLSLTGPLQALLTSLYRLFMEYGCMLCEINPLIINEDGGLVALDGKVSVDDSGLYRHPNLIAYRDNLTENPFVLEARSYRFLFIPIEEGGEAAVISNGSGMLMSCMDLMAKRGVATGAALDLGGGATSDRIAQAVRIMLSVPGVRVLFISIFGGITRCDEVADGLRTALASARSATPVVIRMEGTRREEGLQIIGALPGVIPVDSIPHGVETVVREVRQ